MLNQNVCLWFLTLHYSAVSSATLNPPPTKIIKKAHQTCSSKNIALALHSSSVKKYRTNMYVCAFPYCIIVLFLVQNWLHHQPKLLKKKHQTCSSNDIALALQSSSVKNSMSALVGMRDYHFAMVHRGVVALYIPEGTNGNLWGAHGEPKGCHWRPKWTCRSCLVHFAMVYRGVVAL